MALYKVTIGEILYSKSSGLRQEVYFAFVFAQM